MSIQKLVTKKGDRSRLCIMYIKNQMFSITIAEAPPPPFQIPAPPSFPPFCFKTWTKVTKILDPEFPSG